MRARANKKHIAIHVHCERDVIVNSVFCLAICFSASTYPVLFVCFLFGAAIFALAAVAGAVRVQYFVFDFHMAPAMLFDKIITLSVSSHGVACPSCECSSFEWICLGALFGCGFVVCVYAFVLRVGEHMSGGERKTSRGNVKIEKLIGADDSQAKMVFEWQRSFAAAGDEGAGAGAGARMKMSAFNKLCEG